MSCQTCDHTMAMVIPEFFWCQRCGSIKTSYMSDSPALVAKARVLLKHFDTRDRYDEMKEQFWVIGITESIYRPEERQDPRKES